MPFYIADYLADTRHLGALEHGAYVLLLMHYWQTGGLPDDDAQLARIACTTPGEWRKIRGVIAGFFKPGWNHGRVDAELAKASDISEKRRGAAEEMHSKRLAKASAKASANADTLHNHTSPSQEDSKLIPFGKKGEARPPPKHGTVAKAKGRVYVRKGTPEGDAYADDYRQVHGQEPNWNAYGGRWFKLLGEAS